MTTPDDVTVVSLFGGIEGFGLAFDTHGCPPVAVVEIDPACRGNVRHHYPNVPIFNDVTKVTADELIAAGFVPRRGCLTAGFPCQDLSPAGLRKGLAGTRSSLFWHIMRLADDLSPQWIILENSDGLLSSNRGRDMGIVVRALEQRGYCVAWRVLDAQWFGLAQRRKRVFLVASLGDRAGPVEILFEPESGAGDFAPRGEAGSCVAGTIGARAGGGCTTEIDRAGAYVEQVGPVLGGGRRGHRMGADEAGGGQIVGDVLPFDRAQVTHPANGSNPKFGDPAATLAAHNDLHIAGTLRSHPRAGSNNDGAVTVVDQTFAVVEQEAVEEPRTYAHRRWPADDAGTFYETDHAPALTKFYTDSSTFVEPIPVALRGREGGNQIEAGAPGEPAHALRSSSGGSSHGMIAHTLTSGGRSDGVSRPGGSDASEDGTGRGTPIVALAVGQDMATAEDQALSVTGSNGQPGTIAHETVGIRRLTPLECERLQGLPEDWTRYRVDEKTGRVVEQSDSIRYAQIGNSVAIPVVSWIAGRLLAVARRGVDRLPDQTVGPHGHLTADTARTLTVDPVVHGDQRDEVGEIVTLF